MCGLAQCRVFGLWCPAPLCLHTIRSRLAPISPGVRRTHVRQLCFEQVQLWGPALMSGYYCKFGHFGYLDEICLWFYSLEISLKRADVRFILRSDVFYQWCLFCLINRKGFRVSKMKHSQNLHHNKILLPVTPRLSQIQDYYPKYLQQHCSHWGRLGIPRTPRIFPQSCLFSAGVSIEGAHTARCSRESPLCFVKVKLQVQRKQKSSLESFTLKYSIRR